MCDLGLQGGVLVRREGSCCIAYSSLQCELFAYGEVADFRALHPRKIRLSRHHSRRGWHYCGGTNLEPCQRQSIHVCNLSRRVRSKIKKLSDSRHDVLEWQHVYCTIHLYGLASLSASVGMRWKTYRQRLARSLRLACWETESSC